MRFEFLSGVIIMMASNFYPENGGAVSEMLVTIYRTTWSHIREGSSLRFLMKNIFLKAAVQYKIGR
jgi:hypothetical protein